MLYVGRYTGSAVIEPGDPFTSTPPRLGKNNWRGNRCGWVYSPAFKAERMVHDNQYVANPSTDTNVPELVPDLHKKGLLGGWLNHGQLVVFECRDVNATRHYPSSTSGWTIFEVYQAAMMQLIRDKVPFKHQPAVNRLVKLLLKQAAGKEVRMSQILAQFEELLKLGCPARFLLDLQGLFWTDLSIQEINNPLAVELAPAPS